MAGDISPDRFVRRLGRDSERMRRQRLQPLVEHTFERKFDFVGRQGRVVNAD
jgi:hypothetical protein